jgi:anti-sigma regulatory factor (Ser/Thr protein kinase)
MTDPKPARTDAELRRTMAEFSVPSEPGNERLAMETVAEAIRDLDIRGENLERLKTAVAEATMNAMEHGNKYRAEVPVEVMVLVEDRDLMVRITDGVVDRHRPRAGIRRIWRRNWKVCRRPEDGDCSL